MSQRHHLLGLRARSLLALYTSQKSHLGSAQQHQLYQVIGVGTEIRKNEVIWPKLNRELVVKPWMKPWPHCSRPVSPLSQGCLLFPQSSLEPPTHPSPATPGQSHYKGRGGHSCRAQPRSLWEGLFVNLRVSFFSFIILLEIKSAHLSPPSSSLCPSPCCLLTHFSGILMTRSYWVPNRGLAYIGLERNEEEETVPVFWNLRSIEGMKYT